MGKDLRSLSPLSSKCVIYKVPERLRHVKKSAYTPKVVSIGPLHHGGDQGVRAMEEHKLRYLGDFIRRTSKSLEFFHDFVRKKEAKLRGCDAETMQFSVEYLLNSFIPKLQDENDCIFKKPWLIQDVWTDLLCLKISFRSSFLRIFLEKYTGRKTTGR